VVVAAPGPDGPAPAGSAPDGPAPTGLPVEDVVDDVRAALAAEGHAVLVAPPGAGKTTVVPLRLLGERWLGAGRIVVLEPRRLATRAAARRMAALLGEEVGETVGYRTRDERQVGPRTRVEVVTEGILTRRLQHDPALPGVGLVIFDELHERNLNADLALAFALDARAAVRPDLRLLAMSATIEAAKVASLLGSGGGSPAPVVASEGRQHPVAVRWVPPAPVRAASGPRRRPGRPGPPRDASGGRALAAAVEAVVLRALREEPGDVLVFLPGAADIRRAQAVLAEPGVLPPAVDVRPLFGNLPAAEQDAALLPSPTGRRRVVLATDIAETSLTVEGVRVVVDTGLARTPRFDPRSGLTKLHTGPISRASAEQRTGRAGRTEPGVAYRLWSKVEHAGRRPFADPEITTVDLTGLALELAVWGSDADGLSFLDPPPPAALADGRALLAQLGALDDDGRPTALGREMAELPLHPRLARMVIGARALGLGWEACVLAALLEDRDVLRGRPEELPVDVTERVRLIDDPAARHPAADVAAVRGAARRAVDLARRAGLGRGRIDRAGTSLGLVLALAYPDRIAQARGGARFRLRSGAGAWLPAGDPLAAEPFLVIAELDSDRRDSRVRMAAALDVGDVETAAGAGVEEAVTLAWDPERDDLRARVERRLGGLVLAVADTPAPVGPETTRALLAHVRATRLAVLGWSDGARALQRRVAFARRALGERWPDLSDAALLASLDDWLAPLLVGATSGTDLAGVDMRRVLRARLGPGLGADLDRLAPEAITLATGRRVPVDYAGDQPSIAAKVQDLFGTTSHPAVAGGRVPLLVHLLSPAGRPVQVTSDLPGFWTGSWAAVRKEMAGRYPKHSWPVDPSLT
jgi:ATP-dependent helicase HrpB